MKNTKLWALFQYLSKWELQALDKFLRSPYFNVHEKVYKLFVLLTESNDTDLTKQELFTQLFPDEAYQDARLRHLMSDLHKLIEEFLVIQELRKKPDFIQLELAKLYNQKLRDKHFFHAYRQHETIREKQPLRDVDYLNRCYQASSTLYLNFVARRKRDYVHSLQQTMDDLDHFYMAEKLRLSCAMLNNQSILGAEYDIRLLESVLVNLPEINIPAIRIYQEILQTFLASEKSEQHFQNALDHIRTNGHCFSKPERYDIHIYLLNYCIRRINQRGEYLRTSFEIYQSMIEQEVLVRQDYLSPWFFKNVVVIGLRLDEVVWVEEFIEGFRHKIQPEFRENAYVYNLAYLNFYQKNFQKVLQLLQQVRYNDIFYNLDSKALLLKSYYELSEFEPMYSLMDSFRILLRRKKNISEKHRQNFSNLIRFTRKASRLMEGQQKKAQHLIREIEKAEHVADKKWILGKVRAMLPT